MSRVSRKGSGDFDASASEVRIVIKTTAGVKDKLQELLDSGFYGKTLEEAAERFLAVNHRRLKAAACERRCITGPR